MGDDDGNTAGKADEKIDDDGQYESADSDGGKTGIAYPVTDDKTVCDVVQHLKKLAEEYRHCENKKSFADRSRFHVYFFS